MRFRLITTYSPPIWHYLSKIDRSHLEKAIKMHHDIFCGSCSQQIKKILLIFLKIVAKWTCKTREDILVLFLSVNIGRLTNIVDDLNPMNISKR